MRDYKATRKPLKVDTEANTRGKPPPKPPPPAANNEFKIMQRNCRPRRSAAGTAPCMHKVRRARNTLAKKPARDGKSRSCVNTSVQASVELQFWWLTNERDSQHRKRADHRQRELSRFCALRWPTPTHATSWRRARTVQRPCGPDVERLVEKRTMHMRRRIVYTEKTLRRKQRELDGKHLSKDYAALLGRLRYFERPAAKVTPVDGPGLPCMHSSSTRGLKGSIGSSLRIEPKRALRKWLPFVDASYSQTRGNVLTARPPSKHHSARQPHAMPSPPCSVARKIQPIVPRALLQLFIWGHPIVTNDVTANRHP
ncbi:hypothetical protein HPB50_023891 [Hyalomma asiaticum]|uniref:Uncharacterized protein n=1 Tax=Hyalomma asiaticum TaxID=266040 RepID=A0ACB7SKQ6_HYAAI|nr:hypothetical protein HPB50_023891 [Hyalomma asiaticum]